MTRGEWLQIAAYLTAGCGKTLKTDAMEVYFDLLHDLPFEAMKTAAQRVLAEHPWATFPSIAELRAAGTATVRGVTSELSAAKAWDIAWNAAKYIDLDVPHTKPEALKSVPPLVLEAMNAFGLAALCYGTEPVSVTRSQFVKIFEQLASRDKRESLLPPQVKEAIEANRERLAGVVGKIGTMPAGA